MSLLIDDVIVYVKKSSKFSKAQKKKIENLMDLISDIVRLLDTRLIYKKSMLFYVLAKNNWNLKIFKKTHNGTKKKKKST